MKTKYTSCKRCFDAFLAMFRSRKMIVQCEDWGEKTKQGWGWDWALRNSQPTIFARLPMLLSWRDCRRIFLVLTAAIIQTNARKKAVVTQKRHWRQKRATAIKRPRNLHMIKRMEPLKSGISSLKCNCKKILQIILSCCNQEGLPQIYSGLVNFQFN